MATATQRPEVPRVKTAPRRGERLELVLAGIAPLLPGLAGLIVLEGPAHRPQLNQPPAVILSDFGERDAVMSRSTGRSAGRFAARRCGRRLPTEFVDDRDLAGQTDQAGGH